MKVRTIFLSAIFMCMASFAGAQTIEEAVAKFNEAKPFITAKQFDKAIPVLEKALQMAEAITENDGAIALSEDIKKLIPQMYLYDGVNLVKQSKFQEGIDQLLKAEKLGAQYGNPDVRRNASRFASTAYMAMGIESFNAKDFPKALGIFAKGYEQDPKNIKLALYTAKAYAETKDLENATKLYTQIIAAGKENSKYEVEAKDALADVNNYLLAAAAETAIAKNFDATAAAVDALLGIDPTNDKAQLLIIQCANNLKRYEQVIARGEAAAEAQITPEAKSDVYLMLGVAYQNKGNSPKATEILKKVTAGTSVAQAQQILKDLAAAAK